MMMMMVMVMIVIVVVLMVMIVIMMIVIAILVVVMRMVVIILATLIMTVAYHMKDWPIVVNVSQSNLNGAEIHVSTDTSITNHHKQLQNKTKI